MRLRLPITLLLLVTAACSRPAPLTPSPTPPRASASATAQPATAAPMPASPTDTPTKRPPAPRVFTDPFDVLLAYWIFRHAGNAVSAPAPEARDGYLVFALPEANQWAYAFYDDLPYGDATVKAIVQSRTAGDGAAGVICRYGKIQGWYELNIFQDQTYQLLYGQWLAEGIASYTPLYRGKSAKIQGDENTVALECHGDTLTPFVNGVQLRRWQETKFKLQKGTMGLAVSSFTDAPFAVAFDSVTVSEP